MIGRQARPVTSGIPPLEATGRAARRYWAMG